MRIAVISDIHGNLAALEATLEHLDGEELDEIVVAGDLVNGAADSLACWRLVRSLGYPLLRGNHERYLFDLGTPGEDPSWRDERFAPVRWTANRFDSSELQEMRSLPLSYHPSGSAELLVVHASARSDRVSVPQDAADCEIEQLFGDSAATLMVRGHDHLPSIRQAGERLVVTAGSVGMPLDGDVDGKFVVLEQLGDEWRVEQRRIRYDVEATVRRCIETGYLEEAGPMARLMLQEIVTGRHQMTPFLKEWLSLPEERRPRFEDAVSRYLAA